MIYRVDFDSRYYFSSTTAPTSSSQRTYAIDWSFLPENKKFKMTFSYLLKQRDIVGFSANFVNYIEVNFGTSFQNFKCGNEVSKKTTMYIGTVKPKMSTSNVLNSYLFSLPHHNSPVYLSSRPSSNFISISNYTFIETLSSSSTSEYFMTLYFEEIE